VRLRRILPSGKVEVRPLGIFNRRSGVHDDGGKLVGRKPDPNRASVVEGVKIADSSGELPQRHDSSRVTQQHAGMIERSRINRQDIVHDG
jgi:hypothetical protein